MSKQIRKTKAAIEEAPKTERPIPPTIPKTSIVSTIAQYGLVFALSYLVYGMYHYGFIQIKPLSGPAVLFFSLACAFTWVEILKWGVTKPFICIKCMSGWIALLFSLVFHVDHWYLYWPGGLFIGALFEATKMRWL